MTLTSQEVEDKLSLAAMLVALETTFEKMTGELAFEHHFEPILDPVVDWALYVDDSFSRGEAEVLCWSWVMDKAEAMIERASSE